MDRKSIRLVTDKPVKPQRKYAGQPLECRCGSRTSIEVRLGRTIKNGKFTAGQKQIRCADCNATIWG